MPQSLSLSPLLFLTTLIIYNSHSKTHSHSGTHGLLPEDPSEPSQTTILKSINYPKPWLVQQALPLLPAVAEKKPCPKIPLPLQLSDGGCSFSRTPDIYRAEWGMGTELAIYLSSLSQTLNSHSHIETTCHLAQSPQGQL